MFVARMREMTRKAEIESAATNPQSCKVCISSIPPELKDRPQWVLWQCRKRKGRWTKVPVRPGGKEAKADDPTTWCAFASVANYVNADGSVRLYDGVGFEFSAGDSFTGIDLDDAVDSETHELKPWAKAIVDRLRSYTETSPSGTGVKIWVKGKKPSDIRSRTKYEDGEVEMYDHGRYFAVTGQCWPGTPERIEERQTELDALYQQLFGTGQEEKRPQRKRTHETQSETRSLADGELIEKAKAAKNGDKFSRLFAGDTSDHDGDESRADAALCAMLAFWTDRDAGQMDHLFRSSGLMRAKWDERRGKKTYGERTIEKACRLTQETYRGSRRRSRRGASSANGNGHAANGAAKGQNGKPTVILGTDEYRVNDEAIAALSDPQAAPEVYQRGNQLVRVLRAAKAGKQVRLDRPEGTPRIAAMPGACLCELLTRVAEFVKIKETQEGEKRQPAHPPERAIAAVLARGHYPVIRALEAVIETPTLRPDGTILDTPWPAVRKSSCQRSGAMKHGRASFGKSFFGSWRLIPARRGRRCVRLIPPSTILPLCWKDGRNCRGGKRASRLSKHSVFLTTPT